MDRVPAARDRQALKHLRDQHEQRNDKRGEELADSGCGNDGNRHGQFHCHASRNQIFQRFPENRPAAHKQADHTDHADALDGFPHPKPHRRGRYGNERDTRCFRPFEAIVVLDFMLVMLVVVQG